MTETAIGIDISKTTLDAHRLSDGTAVQFGNDKAGFRALKSWLKGRNVARVVYEPTGPYTAISRLLFRRICHWSR
jgi:transposase